MQSIVYQIGQNLYLNITNRCTNECGFCIRNLSRKFNQQHHLWLEHEPSVEEVMTAIGDPSRYKEIVFCGYGEPLVRLDVVKEVSRKLKIENGKPACRQAGSKIGIRIDTNGQANLFWGRNILPELSGQIDVISISLNADSSQTYEKLCRPAYGGQTFAAVLDFIKEAKKYIPRVEASVVDLPAVDQEKARQLVKELGVSFRVRPYYQDTYVR